MGTGFLESNLMKDSKDLKKQIYSDVTSFLWLLQALQCPEVLLATILALATWDWNYLSGYLPVPLDWNQGFWFFSAVQLPSHVGLCDFMNCSIPGSPVLHYLPEFAQTHVHWTSDAIQPSYPLSPLLLLPSIFPSIRVFSNDSALHIMWPEYWSISFSTSPSNEYSGLIFFRVDWFDLLDVQGTPKSLLQHHNLKASILWCSVFFMVQLSHPYMTTGKTIALTTWTFVGKVTSLISNALSRFVIAFFPRNKCLLISWLQSLSAVILEPKKIKSVTVSTFSPSICHEVMGPDPWYHIFLNIQACEICLVVSNSLWPHGLYSPWN